MYVYAFNKNTCIYYDKSHTYIYLTSMLDIYLYNKAYFDSVC